MADTPNHEYNVPDQGDQNWHEPLNENFEAFEVDIELRDQEANLGNYQPTAGAKFLATDTGVVYRGDGNSWVPTFVHPAYDDAADEATLTQTLVLPEVDVGTITGSLTGGTELTSIAGNNLSISNGQLNASGGGGGGGNWTEANNLLEPADSNIDGIDVDEVNATSLNGGLTGGTALSTIAGNNLSIDSNGQLNATTGGGGGGGGISSLSGGDGINPDSIGDGDTLSVAWGDADGLDSSGAVADWSGAADLDAAGAVDSISGSVTGGTTLTDIAGNNLSIDSNGQLNASTGGSGGGGISSLSGGDGINPDSIGDGDTVSVAWGDANGLDSDGNVTDRLWSKFNDGGTDLLEPADAGVTGVDVGYVVASGIGAESPPFVLRVFGDPVMEMRAPKDDGSGTTGAGNIVLGYETNSIPLSNVSGATVSGGGRDGEPNTVEADYGTVGGGKENEALGENSTVSGGNDNKADGESSTVGGGDGNNVTADSATIGGGDSNTISDSRATIAGGVNNTISSNTGAIGGGFGNTVDTQWGTIAGGLNNTVAGNTGVVGGGNENQAKGWYSTVSGGAPTDSNNVGGTRNIAADDYCTVGGGGNNRAGSDDGNITNATFATVGGGEGNRASAGHSTVPGGQDNEASGSHSFAVGRNATAGNDGAFVVGDSTSNPVSSTAADQAVFQQDLLSRNSITTGNTYEFIGFPDISMYATTPNFGDPQLVLDAGSGGGNVAVLPGGSFSAGGRVQSFGDDNGVAANFSGDVIIGSLQSDTGSNVVINSNDELAVESSSARHKTAIQPHSTSGGVLDLQLHSFEYEETGSEDVGLIAEEVEEHAPEIVTYDDEGRPFGVKYDRVGVHLVPEVRENRDRLDDIEADREDADDRIAELEAENEQLREENAELEARLAAVEDRLAAIEDQPSPGSADD